MAPHLWLLLAATIVSCAPPQLPAACMADKGCPKGTSCSQSMQFTGQGMTYVNLCSPATPKKLPVRKVTCMTEDDCPGGRPTQSPDEAPLTLPNLVVDPTVSPGPVAAPESNPMGTFTVSGHSGVPAMHAALMSNGKAVFLDKIEYYTELKLPNGQLAYSSLYDPETKEVKPLPVATNAFCSGGSFLDDGRLLTVGGNALLSFDPTVGDGFDAVRYLASKPEDLRDGWVEPGNKLDSDRWYASVQMLEDGSLFVASGSKTGMDPNNFDNNNPTYEVLSRHGITNGKSTLMGILYENQPYFMYPFLHLLPCGNLFVFAAKYSQIFNVADNAVRKQLPQMAGLFRTYPNTGGSVLFPLTSKNKYSPEIMICGGGGFQALMSPTDATCGRIQPSADNPQWQMSSMPEGRVMVEGTLLPDGTVLWLNGAQEGAQGFGIARDPALEALIYDPVTSSWKIAGRTKIARLYHSVALLLLDGTILVAGSNPNEMPILADEINPADPVRAFPTDFRVETYTPPYLIGENANRRPKRVQLSTKNLSADGSTFDISFETPNSAADCKVVLYHGGFVTHSLKMGHRMVYLDHAGFVPGAKKQTLKVNMPEPEFGNRVVPPGPYVVYVVVDRVPAIGQFVMVANEALKKG